MMGGEQPPGKRGAGASAGGPQHKRPRNRGGEVSAATQRRHPPLGPGHRRGSRRAIAVAPEAAATGAAASSGSKEAPHSARINLAPTGAAAWRTVDPQQILDGEEQLGKRLNGVPCLACSSFWTLHVCVQHQYLARPKQFGMTYGGNAQPAHGDERARE